MPEGEKGDQEIEYLFEKIMKENFSSLVKELDMQVQDIPRVLKKLDPRRNTPRHIIITLPKTKDKERILKAAREKETITYKGVSMRQTADFSNFTDKKGLERSIQSQERQEIHPRLLYPAKLSFRMEGQIKCFQIRST